MCIYCIFSESISTNSDKIGSSHCTRNNTRLPLSIDDGNARANGLSRAFIFANVSLVTWRRFTRDAHWGKFMSGITEL